MTDGAPARRKLSLTGGGTRTAATEATMTATRASGPESGSIPTATQPRDSASRNGSLSNILDPVCDTLGLSDESAADLAAFTRNLMRGGPSGRQGPRLSAQR